MTAFVIRRLLWTIPLILMVMLVTFALMRGIGGSPFRLEFGGVPYALQLRFERYYGLDDPWFVEFWNYVRHVSTFDFGPSLTNPRSPPRGPSRSASASASSPHSRGTRGSTG